jgi:HK97 family phage major capsid protein
MLARDLTVAGTAGYLVGAAVAPVVDVLRRWSVVARAGITILDDLTSNVVVPRVDTTPTAYALAAEATSITESTPVLGGTPLVPRTLASFVRMSRQLALQANGDTFVCTAMLSALSAFLDRQVLDCSADAERQDAQSHRRHDDEEVGRRGQRRRRVGQLSQHARSARAA